MLLAHRVAWFLTTGKWPPSNLSIDHINGDRHDNRFVNLRLATISENGANRQMNASSRTGVKGVSFCTQMNKFKVKIKSKGVSHHLGYFTDLQEAARSYAKAANTRFGEFARTE